MLTNAYIVCATPRSGSGLLCRALTATGVLGRPSEFFSRAAVHHYLGEWGARHRTSTVRAPVAKPGFGYLDRVRLEASTGGVLALKVHWYQIEWCMAAGLFSNILDVYSPDISPKVIYLYREDKLSQAVSTVIADATRVYYHKPGEPARPSTWFDTEDIRAPIYNFERIKSVIADVERHEKMWSEFFVRHNFAVEIISYEDLCAEYKETIRKAIGHLSPGWIAAVPPPQLIKQTTALNEEFKLRYIYDDSRDAAEVPASY